MTEFNNQISQYHEVQVLEYAVDQTIELRSGQFMVSYRECYGYYPGLHRSANQKPKHYYGQQQTRIFAAFTPARLFELRLRDFERVTCIN